MVTLVNRAKVNTTTTGTGTINLGSAVDGYQTFADAGVVNTNVVRYTIEDGEAWEIGSGTYSSGTLTRSLDESSTGSLLNLSGEAVVYVTATGSDLLQPSDIGSTVQGYDANIVSDASYVHTDNNYTTTEKNKLAGIEAGATADQTKADIDALGIAASTANTLATARNISLTGDVSGSTNFDGSGNVSITAVVADDSHNHVISNVDGLQTALDGKAALNGSSSNNFDARTVKLANLEKNNLDTDGQLGFDSSQGLLVYRTQQGTTGTVSVLDGANVDAGTGVSITNTGTGGTGTESFTFSIGQAVGTSDSPTFAGATIGGGTPWTTANDGSGSGLDADTLDGVQGSSYLRSDASDSTSGDLTISGGQVYVGVNDSVAGELILYGAGTGTTEGAEIRLHASADYDGVIDLWSIDVNQDDLRMFTSAGDLAFVANPDGAVNLYYNGSKKFETTSGGALVSGVLDVSSRVESDDYRSATNQQIQIQAGESFNYSTGQTGEYVYLNGDNGVQINTSPDNWSSGWAGRDTFTFSSSGFQFPDGTTQTTAAPADEQDYGLITGSVTTTNDYGALT